METVSEHIFWKHKELQEEARSANLAVAAFVKVRLVRVSSLLQDGINAKLINRVRMAKVFYCNCSHIDHWVNMSCVSIVMLADVWSDLQPPSQSASLCLCLGP